MEAGNSTVSSDSINALFGDDPQRETVEVSSRQTADDSGQRLDDYLASTPRIPMARPLPLTTLASTSGTTDSQAVTIAGRAGVAPIPRGMVRVSRPVYKLADGEICDEPAGTMTPAEIRKFRARWNIPGDILLRPLEAGELACNPRPGWVAVFEQQFKHGFSLPLSPFIQYILSKLYLSPAQLPPNQWRQLITLGCLYFLSAMNSPTLNEFHALYRLKYSGKAGNGGCVRFDSRKTAIVTNLPSFTTKSWRNKVVMAGGAWQVPGGDT